MSPSCSHCARAPHLTEQLKILSALGSDLAVSSTGFDTVEIDNFVVPDAAVTAISEDRIPDIADTSVTRPGDIWCCSRARRILCGDSCDLESHHRLLASEIATMVFTDLLYNLEIDGHVDGLGASDKVNLRRHRASCLQSASGPFSSAPSD